MPQCRLARCAGVCALLLGSASSPTIAFAQLAGEVVPPERALIDGNGVNVATGTYRVPRVDLTVGSGSGALSDSHIYGRQVWRDARVTLYNPNAQAGTVVVATEDTTYSFEARGTGYAPASDGARLTSSNGIYRLTLQDGTRYTYGAIEKASRHADSREYDYDAYAYVTSIEYPSGLRQNFDWLLASYCVYGRQSVDPDNDACRLSGQTNSGPSPKIWLTRLSGISNSASYHIDYRYAGSSLGTLRRAPSTAEVEVWSRLTGVAGGNSLGGSGSLPSVSYVNTRTLVSGGYLTTDDMTDSLGRTWRYTKQNATSGYYEAVRRPGSSVDNERVNFSDQLRVSSIIRDGATWTYAFSNPTPGTSALVVTDPTGRTQRYESDLSVGLPTKVQDEYGRTTSYTYAANRLKTATAPGGQITTYDYDDNANVVKTTVTAVGGATLSNSATYRNFSCTTVDICNRMETSTDARGVVTTYAYDPIHGGLTGTSTSNSGGANLSSQTRYEQVSGVWMPTRRWNCRTQSSCENTADAVQATTQYNANLLPISVTRGAGDGTLQNTTTSTYTAAGDLLTVDGPLPGTSDTTRYYYDAARLPLGAIGPDPDGGGLLLNRATRNGYDSWGRMTSVAVGTASDQSDGALVDMSVTQTQAATLDDAGRVRSVALSSGGMVSTRTDYAYDAAGRPTCTAVRLSGLGAPADACTVGNDPTYGHDRVTLTQYSPAGAGQVVSISVTNGYGTSVAATETVVQTANGRTASVTDGNGNVTAYAYDGFDRLWRTCYQTTTNAVCAGSPIDYEQTNYRANGDIDSQRLRDGRGVTFGYDALGRRTALMFSNPVDLTDSNVSYTYDLLGRLTLAQDTNGHRVSYTYDALGRVTSESGAWGTLASQYDLAGRRTRLTWGDGFFVTYDYDTTGAMTTVRENGGTVLASYGYDASGRRVSRTLGNGTATSYSYDAASRLGSLTLGGGNRPNAVSFAYNPAGQIASRTASNDAYAWAGAVNIDRPYTVNGLNQYTRSGSVVPGYDARGNLTSAGSVTYLYNSKNQLSGANGTYLYYDPAGRLDQLTQAGLTWEWDGGALATERQGGTIVRRYVSGAGTDEPIVWYEGPGTGGRRWLDADERGSIVRVSDDAGTAIAINSYDEYGIPGAGNLGRFQYTGQMWISELGFYYYKARMYSPTLGRFMQTDPIGYGDGLNWYNYVGSDPVNATDPSGTDALCGPGKIAVRGRLPDPANKPDNFITVPSNFKCVSDPGDKEPSPFNGQNRGSGSEPQIPDGNGGAPQMQQVSCVQDNKDFHDQQVATEARKFQADGYSVVFNVYFRVATAGSDGKLRIGAPAIADFVAFKPGSRVIFEMKTGGGDFSDNQRMVYPLNGPTVAVPVGRNAAAAGYEIGKPIIIVPNQLKVKRCPR